MFLQFKITVFYLNIFKNVIYSCDFKAEFSASLLQWHDPSEIILILWFAAQKTFIIIIMLKTAEYNFFRFLWCKESSEEQHLSEIGIFCNIINVFIITFDQFKASLINKSINFYNPTPPKKKCKLTPSFWMV